MDKSKANMTAGVGDAPIKKQGHTKHSRGFFGTDPNMTGMGSSKNSAVDLTVS